jgi:hypothetical protein
MEGPQKLCCMCSLVVLPDTFDVFVRYRDTTKKKDVREANIEAAKAVADAVRTSLGPRGMDKMVSSAAALHTAVPPLGNHARASACALRSMLFTVCGFLMALCNTCAIVGAGPVSSAGCCSKR